MKNLLFVLLLILSGNLFSQNYGNEWIDYSQTYYSFKITADGVYRISYDDMSNAGIPVASISPDNFQIIGKEREQPIYVHDGGDGNFDSGDYIEFYANKNDGWLDSLLYDDPTIIANPFYSLYNDTLNYFLSWNTGSNLRFTEETAVDYTNYTPSDFVWYDAVIDYHSKYYGGINVGGSYSSLYSEGEGWGSGNYQGSNNVTFTTNLSTRFPYTSGPNSRFHAKSMSNSNAAYTGSGNHHLRWLMGTSDTQLHDEIWAGYRQTIKDTLFPTNLLSNGNTPVKFNIVGDLGVATDYQSLNFVQVVYPRELNVGNATSFKFEVENNTIESKIYLPLISANFTTPTCYVFGDTPRRIPLTLETSTWKALIPNNTTGNLQEVIIESETNIQNISNLTPVNGTGNFTDFSSISFEEAYLIIHHPSLSTATSNYANYRASVNGGSHNVVLGNINELYLQFGGGIDKHIFGIRRFAQYAFESSTQKPVGLLLAGKGIREATEPNSSSGIGSRQSASSYSQSLIPSFGYPSSDNGITAKFGSNPSWAPAIPTGRIASSTNEELQEYLDKMITFEANQDQSSVYNKPDKEWQKQILHFGGGSSAAEQNIFKLYLNNYKSDIEGASFGGNVTSFFKTTTDPIDPTQLTQVNEYLQNGVSLMTFFGHASVTGFDQNLDDPSNWNNQDKYPILIGNACYSGDIFQPGGFSASEKTILLPNEGAIGFLSHTKLGYSAYLNVYTSELYRQMSPLNYGKTFGEQIKSTIASVEGSGSNFLLETTCFQMALHGDPVMKLNWHAKPEIDLEASDVFFTPTDINLTVDSITVNVILTNLGQSITDTFSLEVRRNFPGTSADSLYTVAIPNLHYKDTIRVKIPTQANIGVGLNNFNIKADLPNLIDENYDEIGNNEINTNLFINIDGIIPVIPYNYAVVPLDSQVVKASTINPIADFRTYRFEIDTTDTFNSPEHRLAYVSGLGGVKEVYPNDWLSVGSGASDPLILTDSTVYFWRTAVDSTVLEWRESSFQYIPGKTGWGQDHFFQFKNGYFNGVDYNRSNRKREFAPRTLDVFVDVYDNANSFYEYNYTAWYLNGLLDSSYGEYGICSTTPSIHVAVIDPVKLRSWGTRWIDPQGVIHNPNHNFGNVNNETGCRNRIEDYFIFRQNSPAQLQALENMITNEVPDGHYLLVYSAIKPLYDQWDIHYPNLYNTFAALGSDSIQPGNPNNAFIFFVQKGDPSTAIESVAQNVDDHITLSAQVTGFDFIGEETSTIVGPAAEWQTIYWKQNTLESPITDSTRFRITGLNNSGSAGITIDTVFTANDSIINFNSIIDASQYPYLRLGALYIDSTNSTPAQVDRWHVLYEPLPEAAIDGTSLFTFEPLQDTLNEGEEITFAVDVRNIYDINMDSLLVKYWIEDKDRNKHFLPYPRQDSLRVTDVLRDTITFSTLGFAGDNSLWMEVNPYVNGSLLITDQLEQAHFNNILQVPFFVNGDDVNPILDVTFDGIHILNGDIVNPKSEVVITLKDDNPYLVMDSDVDTTLFGIYLTDPNGIQKRIPFMNGLGEEVMTWIPATESNLKFKILFDAQFEMNGTYELLVQGSDKSQNLSGDLDYRIEFEVILESSITYMMNYPNPFSTNTKFVFTLTGTEVPDDIIIQIMTVSGKIVREITEDEIGPINIGRNITEYSWNGTDEFGDPLANGVYLYRVKAMLNGEPIDHRGSGADSHFKKDFGKMYIMR